MHKNLVKIGHVVLEIYVRKDRHNDTQTHTHIHMLITILTLDGASTARISAMPNVVIGDNNDLSEL